MLHRMAMRVLPALTVAVTETTFRQRKRLVMLLPGLFAYGLYKLLQMKGWHADIAMLLVASGLFSTVVALACYAYGRSRSPVQVMTEDEFSQILWIGGWIGFVWALLLSLMVLGILEVASAFFSYFSYAAHPAAPAMMAVIISSTSVARDAFEIGHLRLLQQQGRPFVTFPDGRALRAMVVGRPELWVGGVLVSAVGVASVDAVLSYAAPFVATDLGQLAVVGLLGGIACTLAFVHGLRPAMTIAERLASYSWKELLRFFMWPGLSFAWAYYFVAVGAMHFLLGLADPAVVARIAFTAGIGALMSLYGYYLGRSRWQEEKLHATISPALLRCPFIWGILTSKKA